MWWTAVALAEPVALVGARIYPVSGPPIPNGTVVFDQGKLVAVGPSSQVTPPAGATVRDVTGKVIVPGLVDTHSHIGTLGPTELNEGSGPLQPALSSIDAIDATAVSLQVAQAGGVTTVNVMPGSRNLIGGQTAYLKLRDAATVDELLLCPDRRGPGCGGLKMANGTNPQGEGTYPRTRMAAAASVRQVFLDAKKRRSELDAPHKRGKPAPAPAPDLAKDPVVEVLRGERVAHFHTHRADDIVTALELGEEFGFVPVLHHVSEGWKLVDRIARSGAPCSVIVIDSPGGKEEAAEMSLTTAGALERAGVPVAIHTDDPITDSRLFLRSAALAVRGGMSEPGALAALTLNGAKMLGLDARVGSLEPGKDADLVVLSGEPFSVWTHVEQTWVEGVVVFDRATDARYATGGWDQAERYPGGAR
ncbi:MAG: amidohydrolase family protein [Myxococcota bacterium]